jgi:hypothetical protein
MEEKDLLSVAITRTVDLRLRKAFRAKGKGSLMEEEYVITSLSTLFTSLPCAQDLGGENPYIDTKDV